MPLKKWKIGRIDSHICPQCAGLFVELDQEGAPTLSRENVNPKERERIIGDGNIAILSPANGKPMEAFLYRGVEIDYCEESNAIWFDPGEIEKARLKPLPERKTLNVNHRREREPFDGLRDKTDIAYYFDVGLLGDFIGGVFDAF